MTDEPSNPGENMTEAENQSPLTEEQKETANSPFARLIREICGKMHLVAPWMGIDANLATDGSKGGIQMTVAQSWTLLLDGGSPVTGPDGEEVPLTDENIEQISANMAQQMVANVVQLMGWKGTSEAYQILGRLQARLTDHRQRVPREQVIAQVGDAIEELNKSMACINRIMGRGQEAANEDQGNGTPKIITPN